MKGVFVTGTDTNVGKTYLSAQFTQLLKKKGKRVGAYKPVCSGAVQHPAGESHYWEDVEALSQALSHQFSDEWICPQKFLAPLAPPVAASLEGGCIDEELLTAGLKVWSHAVEWIIIEGVGGWKCPLSQNSTVEEFAKELGFPVLVVIGQKLGAINHALLTVDAIRQSGLSISGLILNELTPSPSAESFDFLRSNAEQIQKLSGISPLAISRYQHTGEFCDWQSGEVLDSLSWLRLPESQI